MKISTLALGPHLDLQGDVEQEVWPDYLPDAALAHAIMAVIAAFDFTVALVVRKEPGDPIMHFLVGDECHSRLLAIHLDDPIGIIYILEDDGSDCLDSSKQAFPLMALTVKELIQEGSTGIELYLELHDHKNKRLALRAEPADKRPIARELEELVN